MIGFLRGKVNSLRAESCLLDVQGVGYRVFISAATRGQLRTGEEALLFTYLSVREDALVLYGFSRQEEYDVFQMLISVSGVGPKVALGILSSISAADLCRALRGQQLAVLTKLPGVGKKTAQRLILELKDKVAADGAGEGDAALPEAAAAGDMGGSEALAALAALGYSAAEVEPILRRVPPGASVEATIKFVLREFAGGK